MIVEPIDPQQALVDYVRARLQREEAEHELKHGRGYQAKVARESKVSSAHIANIITKDGQGVGMDTAKKLATFWGTTIDKLMAMAIEWAKSEPPRTPKVPLRPNLETAIEVMRRKGPVSDDVVEEARRTGTRDFSVGAWMILLGEMTQPITSRTAAPSGIASPPHRSRPAS